MTALDTLKTILDEAEQALAMVKDEQNDNSDEQNEDHLAHAEAALDNLRGAVETIIP